MNHVALKVVAVDVEALVFAAASAVVVSVVAVVAVLAVAGVVVAVVAVDVDVDTALHDAAFAVTAERRRIRLYLNK